MFDFLGVNKDSPDRQHTGGYQSHVFGPEGQKIKFLMLDARYFRDKAKRENRVYQPNPDGTILGEEQWTWLEHHLRDSSIQLFVLASGIQVLSSQHRFEKWANFPNERQRLIDLIEETALPGVILLSGDRHIGEISVYESEELPYPLVDVTSSGLTHAYTGNTSESNELRHGRIVNQLNFGVMKIDWSEDLQVHLELRGEGGELLESYSVSFKDD
jgi:alkaline phosphatase D